MSKVISTNQVSDNTFVVDYLVDPEEFLQIKETTINELVKEVSFLVSEKVKCLRKKPWPKLICES